MEHSGIRPSGRFQFGEYHLWYRRDRDDWAICWYADGKTHRVQTGIGGGDADNPPQQAIEALTDHHRRHASPNKGGPAAPEVLLIGPVLDRWLLEHVSGLAAPQRYAWSVVAWQRFFDDREKKGDLRARTVSILDDDLLEDFLAFRQAEGVCAPTIERDFGAVRSALNWAVTKHLLTFAPRIPKVEGHKVKRQIEFSVPQLAAIFESAASMPDGEHLFLFILLMVFEHARGEAVLELYSAQIKGDRIHFNAEERPQTRKHRAIVPIVPSVAPWLQGIEGKVVMYRRSRTQAEIQAGKGTFEERQTHRLQRSWRTCLLRAHAAHPELDLARQATTGTGELLWLRPRNARNLKDREWRPKMEIMGPPNALRHTSHTWLERTGVPRAQIETAAGHEAGGDGSGSIYTHVRPDYLSDFVAGMEKLFDELDAYTSAHRHPSDPKHARNRTVIGAARRWVSRALGAVGRRP
ncbi:hypothetical protein [Sphingomonas sp. M1-B02]|uniref:hypothetical protein n=1 Tax=Sphingomonas sp. M1-B02 TaxID=3114300 RepID=UPI00223F1451|nr:hypothetical protein [Sphingomonas sp. S6-11]UZK67850.1 hypothetical protein OKW87_08530 [Sphingomonas sp. S6-11]